jgi:hypothetical protein
VKQDLKVPSRGGAESGGYALSVNSAIEPEGSWVEARLPSGRSVMLRSIDEVDAPGNEDEGAIQDVRFRSVDFKVLTSTLHEIGDLIKSAVRPLAPREAEVELALGLSASTGQLLLLFGDASAEASIKVNLRWEFGTDKDHDEKA